MLETLRAEFGSEAVRAGADTDLRIHGVAPTAVVTPDDADQAAAAMRICAARGWSVRPAGAATWLCAGTRAAADVLVTTERMSGVTDYEPDDLAIAIQAGTTLDELGQTARNHGQFFPVQPPAADGATVGGMIATAAAGPLRLGHGTPRDHVLGLRLVTGDGRVLDLGGRVVKNVAGYDLVRLAVGSNGALGLITRATLRLRPIPKRDITAFFRADDPAVLAQTALHVSEGWPVAAEMIDPGSAATLTGTGGWLLAVRWHGNDAFASHITRWLGGLDPRPELAAGDRAAPFWSELARLEASGTAVIRLTDHPDRLPAFLGKASTLTGVAVKSDKLRSDSMIDPELGILWRIAAHARSGVLRLWSDQASPVHGAVVRSRLRKVRQEVTESGSGSVVPLVLPPVPSRTEPAATGVGDPGVPGGGPRPERAQERLKSGIRRAFDPAAILETVGLPDAVGLR